MDKGDSKKERLQSEIKSASDYSFYAMQRIDLLVISVAGAGIYACWDILKYIFEKLPKADITLLKFAGFLFLSTIILNFIAQWTSYKANSGDEFSKRMQLNEIERNQPDCHKDNIAKSDKITERYSTAVKITNAGSLIALFIGLVLFTTFIYHLF
jgi:hypothetical protein